MDKTEVVRIRGRGQFGKAPLLRSKSAPSIASCGSEQQVAGPGGSSASKVKLVCEEFELTHGERLAEV
jgi:hypothetical protein